MRGINFRPLHAGSRMLSDLSRGESIGWAYLTWTSALFASFILLSCWAGWELLIWVMNTYNPDPLAIVVWTVFIPFFILFALTNIPLCLLCAGVWGSYEFATWEGNLLGTWGTIATLFGVLLIITSITILVTSRI